MMPATAEIAHLLVRDKLYRSFRFELQNVPLTIDIGRRSPAFPVTPPYVRVRIRRFGGLSYRPPVNLGTPSESK
jgi:hypothetical protein